MLGSRWKRSTPHHPAKGPYNGYTVVGTTNTAHLSDEHPPQVIYQGDNTFMWSLPLSEWPGNLIQENAAVPQHDLYTELKGNYGHS